MYVIDTIRRIQINQLAIHTHQLIRGYVVLPKVAQQKNARINGFTYHVIFSKDILTTVLTT